MAFATRHNERSDGKISGERSTRPALDLCPLGVKLDPVPATFAAGIY